MFANHYTQGLLGGSCKIGTAVGVSTNYQMTESELTQKMLYVLNVP
jgi:hypothetical protein